MNSDHILEAESESRFLVWLKLQPLKPLDVPALARDRSKSVMEHRGICLYLMHLHASGNLVFPIILVKRECPDYLLIQRGNTRFGIESTQALPNNYQELEAKIENKKLDTFMDPSHFRFGPVSKKKIRELSEATALTGPPYMGDSIEREWASEIVKTILHKSKKAEKDGYQLFDNNELVILDRLFRELGAEANCGRVLQERVIDQGIGLFNRVSIVSGKNVFVVNSREVSLLWVETRR